MGKMSEIITDEQVNEYHRLCKYCFIDQQGWTDHVFPLPGKDSYALGIFSSSNRLESGVISDLMKTRFFDQTWLSSGISAVVSDPAVRNKGQVRELMVEILKRDYRKGVKISYLYPFSVRFYNKFGYGFLHRLNEYDFTPGDIQIDRLKCPGSFESLVYTKENFEGLCELHNRWIKGFHGGVAWPFMAMEQHSESADLFTARQYVYRGTDGFIKAFIKFFLTPDDWAFKVDIYKAAWDSSEGLAALFHFLWQHREQARRIHMRVPEFLPLFLFMKEPFQQLSCGGVTMARPVDVSAILKQKAKYQGFKGRCEFAVKDPVLEENSGTYLVEGEKVSKKDFSVEKEISFELFSSLLFGGSSVAEAESAGVLKNTVMPDMALFFKKYHSLFVSERF